MVTKMSGEPKDLAIKLFGKTIPLLEVPPEAASVRRKQSHEVELTLEVTVRADEDDRQEDKETASIGNQTSDQQENEVQHPTGDDSMDEDVVSEISAINKASSVDKESAAEKASIPEEECSETSNPQEKQTLRKPDKILPCPRCNSMDTKFCYFNNHNINQPRHFCRKCQRYWTAGGTMRNVPVGAGRRKNKSSASHCHRNITGPEALHNVLLDIPNGVHAVKPDGAVLAFGSSGTPLYKSMGSVLNLADNAVKGGPRNRLPRSAGVLLPGPCGDRPLKGSPAIVPNTKAAEEKNEPFTGFAPEVQCYSGPPWPYVWSFGQWAPTTPLAPPHCTTGFAVPFFPAAAAYWVPSPFSLVTTSSGSGQNSPTLGKHSRDEQNVLKPSGAGEENVGSMKEVTAERSLWIPKTLRIDDPEEAAKSSIWETLGIKNGKAESLNGKGLFKAFQLKGEERNYACQASAVLQANPAALSRSVNFRESS